MNVEIINADGSALGNLFGLAVQAKNANESTIGACIQAIKEKNLSDEKRGAEYMRTAHALYNAAIDGVKTGLEALTLLRDDLLTNSGIDLTMEQVAEKRRDMNGAIHALMCVNLGIETLASTHEELSEIVKP